MGGTIVVVEDDIDQRTLVSRWLEQEGHDVEPVETAEQLVEILATSVPDCVCLDLELPGMTGMEALSRLRATHPQLPVIIVTAEREVDVVVDAMQSGAYDFLPKPLDKLKLLTIVNRALEKVRMSRRIQELERGSADEYAGMIGRHATMRALFREVERVAATDVTVLVHGESGTGKELVARALHSQGARATKPFVAINCAAIPESLQESELFGHERGAFTGATDRRQGRFEEADGGTLFLDEIAELSLPAQAKLLRVLQERTFRRVGGDRDLRSDFRLVAASHQNLLERVAERTFREDLFFRVAVFELDVPPLRERGKDVELLSRFFLRHHDLELQEDARSLLTAYDWPGNVRELENAIRRAVVVAREGVIAAADFPKRIRAALSGNPRPNAPVSDGDGGTMEDLERAALADALQRHGGNVAEVVRELGIGRTTVYRKLKKYGLR
ncbi:MAG: sigma-54-dependent Fis family transcriptional regulator [Deltaproteobacteria bacterium]|nr:sigma-54-dependent Fis family transcriptional regulator [Deltaproteobacteria bacterium]